MRVSRAASPPDNDRLETKQRVTFTASYSSDVQRFVCTHRNLVSQRRRMTLAVCSAMPDHQCHRLPSAKVCSQVHERGASCSGSIERALPRVNTVNVSWWNEQGIIETNHIGGNTFICLEKAVQSQSVRKIFTLQKSRKHLYGVGVSFFICTLKSKHYGKQAQ